MAEQLREAVQSPPQGFRLLDTTWLIQARRDGTTTEEALAFYDALPPVSLDSMIGRWKGAGLRTNHVYDGLLEAFGWYGKEFRSPDDCHPLLFSGGSGDVFAINPGLMPVGIVNHIDFKGSKLASAAFRVFVGLLKTRQPAARLRMMEHRGKVSATMIYDALPIHDAFRSVDAHTVMGLMDFRAFPQPFFFVLEKDRA